MSGFDSRASEGEKDSLFSFILGLPTWRNVEIFTGEREFALNEPSLLPTDVLAPMQQHQGAFSNSVIIRFNKEKDDGWVDLFYDYGSW